MLAEFKPVVAAVASTAAVVEFRPTSIVLLCLVALWTVVSLAVVTARMRTARIDTRGLPAEDADRLKTAYVMQMIDRYSGVGAFFLTIGILAAAIGVGQQVEAYNDARKVPTNDEVERLKARLDAETHCRRLLTKKESDDRAELEELDWRLQGPSDAGSYYFPEKRECITKIVEARKRIAQLAAEPMPEACSPSALGGAASRGAVGDGDADGGGP